MSMRPAKTGQTRRHRNSIRFFAEAKESREEVVEAKDAMLSAGEENYTLAEEKIAPAENIRPAIIH